MVTTATEHDVALPATQRLPKRHATQHHSENSATTPPQPGIDVTNTTYAQPQRLQGTALSQRRCARGRTRLVSHPAAHDARTLSPTNTAQHCTHSGPKVLPRVRSATLFALYNCQSILSQQRGAHSSVTRLASHSAVHRARNSPTRRHCTTQLCTHSRSSVIRHTLHPQQLKRLPKGTPRHLLVQNTTAVHPYIRCIRSNSNVFQKDSQRNSLMRKLGCMYPYTNRIHSKSKRLPKRHTAQLADAKPGCSATHTHAASAATQTSSTKTHSATC
jgi:hypothetical protein